MGAGTGRSKLAKIRQEISRGKNMNSSLEVLLNAYKQERLKLSEKAMGLSGAQRKRKFARIGKLDTCHRLAESLLR